MAVKENLAKLYAEKLAELIESDVVELSSGFCVPVYFPELLPDEWVKGSFSVEPFEKKVDEIREALFRLNRLKKWVKSDFQFESKKTGKAKIEVEMHDSSAVDACWRFKFVSDGNGAFVSDGNGAGALKVKFYFCPLDYYCNEIGDGFGYRVIEKSREGLATGEAKEVFLKLIDSAESELSSRLREYQDRVDFLNQPVGKNGITRRQEFWKWEREFYRVIDEVFVPKPEENLFRDLDVWQFELYEAASEEGFDWLETKIHGINRLKSLIKQMKETFEFKVVVTLNSSYFSVERGHAGKIEIRVPAYYVTEDAERKIPLSRDPRSFKGVKGLLEYLDELENFVKQYVLRLRIKRKQEKDKKLMI